MFTNLLKIFKTRTPADAGVLVDSAVSLSGFKLTKPITAKFGVFRTSNENLWNQLLTANVKSYKDNIDVMAFGVNTCALASRWAERMEAELAKGKKLVDVYKPTTKEVREDGAEYVNPKTVGILADTWIHGKELKKIYCKDNHIPTNIISKAYEGILKFFDDIIP